MLNISLRNNGGSRSTTISPSMLIKFIALRYPAGLLARPLDGLVG